MTIPDLPERPFTLEQAVSTGFSRAQVRAAVTDGRLVRVLRDVYAVRQLDLTPVVRAQAAGLVTSPHAIVCDRTASWIHGVESWRMFELDVSPALETCVLRGHEPTERSEIRCLTRDLVPADWMVIGGVRVTTPLRTAMDLGCRLPRRTAFATMNALAAAHDFDRFAVLSVLPRYRRRRGVVQLKQLAHLLEPRVESRRESWVLIDIADHGLPLPRPQYWVVVDGVAVFRLDFAYPHAKIVVEYDGEEHHTSLEDREHDRVRRDWLHAHGWRVIVVTKESFEYDAVPGWILELRSALRVAA